MTALRLVTLNLNHRTAHRPVPPALLSALCALHPDVLVLTEYVERRPRPDLRKTLADAGLPHVAVSTPGRERCNQVLIASRGPLAVRPAPPDAPCPSASSNLLAVTTVGLTITGLRAPAYVRASDWYHYWAWLPSAVHTGLVIGDLNADPTRNRPRDRVLAPFLDAGGWTHRDPEGLWSYRGPRACSRLDHVLWRPPVIVDEARYVSAPFVPRFTDHAALVVTARSP